MHEEDPKLVEARWELEKTKAQMEAAARRLAAGDNAARSQINAAIRRSEELAGIVADLEADDREARGLPRYSEIQMVAAMYGGPVVPPPRLQERRPPAPPPPAEVRAPRRSFWARLFGRK